MLGHEAHAPVDSASLTTCYASAALQITLSSTIRHENIVRLLDVFAQNRQELVIVVSACGTVCIEYTSLYYSDAGMVVCTLHRIISTCPPSP